MSAPPIPWISILVILVIASPALAHGGESHGWNRWNWDIPTLASLGLLGGVYAAGMIRLRRSAAPACAARGTRPAWRWQSLAFAASILALFVALVSPIDPMSDELQSAHMVQHMLIMTVAAPLFVLGSPALVMLWALPRRTRRSIGEALGRLGRWRPPWYLLWQPLLMCALFALALWVWHLPVLYEAALRSRLVHEAQHIMFFVASALFWRVLFDPLSRLRLSLGAGVLYLFITSLHATFLGVFMALAPRVWYDDYLPLTSSWNLTPLEDQQLAGLIMWMPACMIYAAVAAILFAVWVHDPQEEPSPCEPGVAPRGAEGGA